MRVGVIRGDMPGAVTLEDLETVSQYNPPIEPRGQVVHVARPTVASVGAALAVVPAGRQGSVDISGGANIGAGNKVLRARVAVGPSPYVVVTLAEAVYASGAALVTATNAAIATAGLQATARLDDSGDFMVLQSNTSGPGSFIEIDTVANGSTFNTPVGFGAGGGSFTVPSATALITATLPVGGPLDVSNATLDTNIGKGATAAQRSAVADSIAPHIVDTDVAIKSFQVGMMSGFRSASYNPDPNRIPALSNGAAIEVVQDDGTTPFAAPLTVISGAADNTPNGGDITITGTNLGDPEVEATVVRVTSADGSRSVKLYQAVIAATNTAGTQGSVSATSIVIPASLLSALGIAGSKVQVQYTSLASNVFTVT